MPINEAIDTLTTGAVPMSSTDTIFSADIETAISAPAKIWLSSPSEHAEAADTAETIPAWTMGMESEQRPSSPADNSWLSASLTALIVLMMLSVSRNRRLFRTLWDELVGMRRRENAFDERTTRETSTILLMVVQWSFCVGLLLFNAISIGDVTLGSLQINLPAYDTSGGSAGIFVDAARFVALAAVYYGVQYCVYSAIGYTFSDPVGHRLYVQGFTASQSLLGFALLVPTLISLFYPSTAPLMVSIGAMLYIIARIVFIIKGFRIFYINFLSILNFILYLCAIEIIPLSLIYKIALFLL